jgi:hypothetical protein
MRRTFRDFSFRHQPLDRQRRYYSLLTVLASSWMQEFKTGAKTRTAASTGGRSAFHNGQSLASLKSRRCLMRPGKNLGWVKSLLASSLVAEVGLFRVPLQIPEGTYVAGTVLISNSCAAASVFYNQPLTRMVAPQLFSLWKVVDHRLHKSIHFTQ